MERELNLDVVEGACLAVQRRTHLEELLYWEGFVSITPLGASPEETEARRSLRERAQRRIDTIREDLLKSAGC